MDTDKPKTLREEFTEKSSVIVANDADVGRVHEKAEQQDTTLFQRTINSHSDGNANPDSFMELSEGATHRIHTQTEAKKEKEKKKAYSKAIDGVVKDLEGLYKRLDEVNKEIDYYRDKLKEEFGEDISAGIADKYGEEQKEGETDADFERRMLKLAAADGNENAANLLAALEKKDELLPQIAAAEKAAASALKKEQENLVLVTTQLTAFDRAQTEYHAIEDIEDPEQREAAKQEWKAEHGVENGAALNQKVAELKIAETVLKERIGTFQDKLAEAESQELDGKIDVEFREDLEESVVSDVLDLDFGDEEPVSTASAELVQSISAASEVKLGSEIGGDLPTESLTDDFQVAALGEVGSELSSDIEVSSEIKVTPELSLNTLS